MESVQKYYQSGEVCGEGARSFWAVSLYVGAVNTIIS